MFHASPTNLRSSSDHRPLYPSLSFLSQSQFAWQAPQLLVSAGWVLPQLPVVCHSATSRHAPMPCLVQGCTRLGLGGLLAPLALLYVLEIVSRRAFLAHKVLVEDSRRRRRRRSVTP